MLCQKITSPNTWECRAPARRVRRQGSLRAELGLGVPRYLALPGLSLSNASQHPPAAATFCFLGLAVATYNEAHIKAGKLDLKGLVPIRESYGGDVSEPLGELTKHPLLGLLELYKRGVELLD